MAEIDIENTDQAAFWNGIAGQRWVERQAVMDRLLAPISAELFRAIDPAPGGRVLDIGCGSGETSFELARRVGQGGHVTGLDISAPLLALARRRTPAGAPVSFVEGDATVHQFAPGAADLLFSRFGVMFFADPARSFANMRRGLRPGAAVTFSCWREIKRNPWALLPFQAAQKALPEPIPDAPVDPDAPGPYSFASDERVTRILTGAGFAEISLRPVEVMLDVGGGDGMDGAVALALAAGPSSRLLDKQPEAVRAAAVTQIREALAPYVEGAAIPMAGALWIVTARNPKA
jgi:SAM-dependent methyltransferase